MRRRRTARIVPAAMQQSANITGGPLPLPVCGRGPTGVEVEVGVGVVVVDVLP